MSTGTIKKKQVDLLLKRESEVWLYSYADLITNLLAFFIMLLTISHSESSVAKRIQESIRKTAGAVGAAKTPTAEDVQVVVSQFIREANLKNDVAVQKQAEGVSLTFAGGFFFETLSARLTPQAEQALSKLSPLFTKLPKNFRIDVGGHADLRPVQDNDQYASNWELSAARAGAVVRFLASQGVSPGRMRAIGYSDTQPVSRELDQNRRVVISVGRGLQ